MLLIYNEASKSTQVFELSHQLRSASKNKDFKEINNAEQFLSLLQEGGKTCIAVCK